MNVATVLDVPNRQAWRAWLEANHASEREVWLVYYRKSSGKPRIPYNDSVEEALCFGWIDSTMKNVDDERFAQRFTPRRPGSPWSAMNQERVHRLIAEGKMTPAGLVGFGELTPQKPIVPADILQALQSDAQAWENFQGFPDSYQRIRIGWIDGARTRPEVFQQPLAYCLKMTAKNRRFGMVR